MLVVCSLRNTKKRVGAIIHGVTLVISTLKMLLNMNMVYFKRQEQSFAWVNGWQNMPKRFIQIVHTRYLLRMVG